MILSPRLYSSAPPAKTKIEDNPTLLISWWCTGFALAVILVRLSGRYIRTERLFREDKIMALSIIPLLARMGCVHMVLLWGTNNTVTTGLTPLEIQHREIGSKLVLISRIMYAAFLWVAKFTISEFLKRLTSQVWKRSYEVGLHIIRWFLMVTFVAVIIATLAECQPFYKYWQVVPDPGGNCRQGYAQLITMGSSDVITDLLLVAFPIPIVMKSHMAAKRKLSLVLLFALSLILVAITIFRVIGVIDRNSDQQFRSQFASIEVLAAAAVSNALVLGSFVRDRGAKKQRYRVGSTGGSSSLDRTTGMRHHNTITVRNWGSDADLASDLGMRLGPEFADPGSKLPRPAPIALPLASQAHVTPKVVINRDWAFPSKTRASAETDETDIKASIAEGSLSPPSPSEVAIITPRRMSFFDVGGLLEDAPVAHPFPRHRPSVFTPLPPALSPRMDSQGPSILETGRKGSYALLQDIGALPLSHPPFPPPPSDSPKDVALRPAPMTRNFSRPSPLTPLSRSLPPRSSSPTPASPPPSMPSRKNQSLRLRDVGGLLD